MGKAHGRPEHNVFIADGILAIGPDTQAGILLGLVGELSRSVELVVTVLGDPVRVGSKLGALGVVGVLVSKQHLCSGHVDLVCKRLLGGRVDLVLIDNLELTVGKGVLVKGTRALDVGRLRDVANSVRVDTLISGQRHSLLVHDGVLLATNGSVQTERKHVLVVGSNDTRSDNGSPGNNNIVVNGHGRENTSGTDLNVDTSSLVKNVLNNVLVVGNSSNGLQNKYTLTGYGGHFIAVVEMLVKNTIILLVHADNVLTLDRVTLRIRNDTIKVADNTKTVASETQGVGTSAKADITQIKGLLAVEGSAGITVGDGHLRKRNTVKEIMALESKVVKNKTLANVETNAEGPALPLNKVVLGGE